jgi:hypothetical protein
MENNILGGLTGLPPNMTAKDWARITDTTAVLNKEPLKVTKTESVKEIITNPNAIVIDKKQLIKYAIIGAIIYVVFIK